jgi:plastocyanin
MSAILALLAPFAMAEESLTKVNASGQIEIMLDEHSFSPSEIHVKAGKSIQLLVKNNDSTPEEFDSHDLKTEKVIAAGTSGVIRLRPLAPGRYSFSGEYHSDTAKGVLVVE